MVDWNIPFRSAFGQRPDSKHGIFMLLVHLRPRLNSSKWPIRKTKKKFIVMIRLVIRPRHHVPGLRSSSCACRNKGLWICDSVRGRRLHANTWWPRQKNSFFGIVACTILPRERDMASGPYAGGSGQGTHGRYVTNNLEAFLMVADYRPVCGDTRLWLA